MSIINRVTTWATNQLLTSSALNGEFNNLINFLNNVDSGSTSWDNVKTTASSITSLTATNLTIGSAPFVYTDWASFTATVNGCGSVSGSSFFYRQVGNNIEVRGNFQCGTVSGSTNFGISGLPNSTVINSSHLPTSATSLLGQCYSLHGTGGPTNFAITDVVPMFYDGSTTTQVFGTVSWQNGDFLKVEAGSVFSNGYFVALYFSYPI